MAEGLWEPDLVRPCPPPSPFASPTPASSAPGADYLLLRLCPLPAAWIRQEPEDLFETISQVLLNALDRDALSGNGAVVHVMCVAPFSCRSPSALPEDVALTPPARSHTRLNSTQKDVTTRYLKGRQD